MKLLLVEDDELLSDSLRLALEGSNYTVDSVRAGREARGALADSRYDLLLLDLGLPDMDGTTLLKELRQCGITVPVIIITARDTIMQKVLGLEIGANDYVTKPFDFQELKARIKAVLRKDAWANRSHVTVGRLRFDTNSHEVVVDGRVVAMTPKEIAALTILLRELGRLVPKEELMDRLSTWEKGLSENGVETIIHRLRQKLSPAQVDIRTIRGFGYVLEKPNEKVHT